MIDTAKVHDVISRCRIRANIRRNIPHRKSVQEGKADRIADLFDECADTMTELLEELEDCGKHSGYQADPEFG